MDKISAFMDGEAAPAEAQQALSRLRQDAGLREAWDRFHLVGDALRGDLRGEPLLGDAFLARLRERLDAEPTVVAPRRRWRTAGFTALAVAASLAFVTVAVRVAMPERSGAPGQEVAQAAPEAGSAQVAKAPIPAQVNDYLQAHHEFSPHSALQGVAPYVRSVSATHDGNRR